MDPGRGMIEEMDFTNPDSQPDERKLNELIWKSVKEPKSQMPAAPVNPSPVDHD